MKTHKIFTIIGIVLVVLAIGFIGYALNNPQGNFPWSISVTHTKYLLYLLFTAVMFILAIIFKKRTK